MNIVKCAKCKTKIELPKEFTKDVWSHLKSSTEKCDGHLENAELIFLVNNDESKSTKNVWLCHYCFRKWGDVIQSDSKKNSQWSWINSWRDFIRGYTKVKFIFR